MFGEEKDLKIAIKAENITEATPFNSVIQRLPASVDYLEGLMPLRGDITPAINSKKRLGLDEHLYGDNVKVAVISLYNQHFGLTHDSPG